MLFRTYCTSVRKSRAALYLEFVLEAVVDHFGRDENSQTHQTGQQVADVGAAQVCEDAVPGLEQSEPALRSWDLQAQKVFELGREDGQRGSGREAAQERVGQEHGDEAHLENTHQHLQQRKSDRVQPKVTHYSSDSF